MQLEPPNLKIPLYRRDWSALWFALAGCGCAWLWYRPTSLSLSVISVLLGGPAFYFGLGPALHGVRHHRLWSVRLLFLVCAVGGIFIVMNYVVPSLHAYVVAGA